ncbi:MAG: 50S ribosomal protein L1 [Phycisphaerae bacterium]|nr:50S ribosomal protein L1 [Phycisphaerae bacterium]
MRFRSKRYRKDSEKTPSQPVPLDEGLKKLKGFSKTKFDQSVDLVLHLGIDARQADQMIRGSIAMPKGIGKTKRVIAFCGEGDVEAAKEAGAMEAGADELVEKVQKGWMDFDVAIAHPSLMGKVGRLGRILGPQGKMPSPKSGTVTPKVAEAVKEYAAGKVEFRNDSGGNVHTLVGKLSFTDEDLKANIVSFVDHIRRMKPAAAKGTFMKKLCLSGTMTPAVEIEVATAISE